MGYVEQNLAPDEQLVTKANLHWIMFLGPIVFVVFGALLVLYSSINPDSPVSGLPYLSLLVIFLGLLAEIQVAVVYRTTEFAVTTKRIIAKSGWLHRKSSEILLGKVESINVDQSFLGSLFGFGTLMIIGTGGTKEFFPNIADAIEFRNSINAQVARAR